MTFDRVALLIFISDFSLFMLKDADEGSDEKYNKRSLFLSAQTTTKAPVKNLPVSLSFSVLEAANNLKSEISEMTFSSLGNFPLFSLFVFSRSDRKSAENLLKFNLVAGIDIYAAGFPFLWGWGRKISVKFFNFNSSSWVCRELWKDFEMLFIQHWRRKIICRLVSAEWWVCHISCKLWKLTIYYSFGI